MGVNRLFYYMTQHHGDCMVPAVMSPGSAFPQTTDILCIDGNAFVYPVVQRVLDTDARGPATPWAVLVDAILEALRETLRWVRPAHGVYIAIDGVAGSAKQAQQRKRRFKTTSTATASSTDGPESCALPFDTTAISTGSPFLAYLQLRLKSELVDYDQDGSTRTFHVWISDDAIAGEGEHKLIRFVEDHVRSHAEYHYTVMSIDADVLILMLGLMLPRSAVLKRDLFSRDPGAYRLVDIAKWADLIYEEWKSPAYVSTRQQTLHDFVAASCLFGNDFIPAIEATHLGFDGWDHLNLAYLEAVSQHGPLVTVHVRGHTTTQRAGRKRGRGEETEEGEKKEGKEEEEGKVHRGPEYILHRPTAQRLAACLATVECTVLAHRAHSVRTRSRPDTLLRLHVSAQPDPRDGTLTPRLDEPAYRAAYYARNFHFDGEREGQLDAASLAAAEAYFRGIEYTLVYYLTGIPDWTWSYPHHYAPLCSDLARIDPHIPNERWPTDSVPAHACLALLSIMPLASLRWVPFDCTALSKALPAWFDRAGLRVDLEGKINDYEAVTILPGVDMAEQRQQVLAFYAEHVRERSSAGLEEAEEAQSDGTIFAEWTRAEPSVSQLEFLQLTGARGQGQGHKHGVMFHAVGKFC